MTEPVIGRRVDGSPVALDLTKLVWRPSVYALIFDGQGNILLVDNFMNGKKHFPGGGVEIQESVLDALHREVWEEVGLKIAVDRLCYNDDDFYLTEGGSHWHVVRFYYRAHVTGGGLRDSLMEWENSGNPHWIDPQDLTADDFSTGWEALCAALEP